MQKVRISDEMIPQWGVVSDSQQEVEVQNGWLHLSRLQLRSREGIWRFAPWNVTKKEAARLFTDLFGFCLYFFPLCFHTDDH